MYDILFFTVQIKLAPREHHLTQGSQRELDYWSYLTQPDLATKAVHFMLETGLLGQFRAIAATYWVIVTDLRAEATSLQGAL